MSTVWPHYAFWFATGISDPQRGLVAPGDQGFPTSGEEEPSSSRYFREAMMARTVAGSAAARWLDAKPESGMDSALSERLLRVVGQIDHATTPELQDRLKRVRLASELRHSEIALQNDMPQLDYDETETALALIKRLLARSMDNYTSQDMANELNAVQQKIEHLDAMITRHRTLEKTLADTKSKTADKAQ